MVWFKHYADSLKSNSLRELKRRYGFEGLGRYWAFLEYLHSQWDYHDAMTKFEIQREDLRDLFGIRSWNGLETFVDHLATIPGIDAVRSGNVYEINAPILLKLLHCDFKKTVSQPESIRTKRKRERKEIEIDNNTIVETADNRFQLEKLWNENCGDLPKIRCPVSSDRLRRINARLKAHPDEKEWLAVIEKIRDNPFCNGLTGKGWRATFDWILRPGTFDKVLEGTYDATVVQGQSEYEAAFKKLDIALLKKHIPQVANHFGGYEVFSTWANKVLAKANGKGITGDSESSYIASAIRREVGIGK